MFGKVIGNLMHLLIAKKANAWDSTKSPSISNSSISFTLIFDGRFLINLFINILFFLPPPQIKISLIKLFFFNKIDKDSPIILAVNSVKVAAPSSKDSPLTKAKSKSFISKDLFNSKLSKLKF